MIFEKINKTDFLNQIQKIVVNNFESNFNLKNSLIDFIEIKSESFIDYQYFLKFKDHDLLILKYNDTKKTISIWINEDLFKRYTSLDCINPLIIKTIYGAIDFIFPIINKELKPQYSDLDKPLTLHSSDHGYIVFKETHYLQYKRSGNSINLSVL